MGNEQKRSGKKGRKVGRQTRSPSHSNYNAERRWEENKRRKARKHANKTGKPVKIKIGGKWETILPE